MRVLIVAEGKHELSGALECLVRRLMNVEASYDLEKLSLNSIRAFHGKGRGYLKKAIRWMLEARKRGYEGVILIVDEDDRPERREEIADAQESPICDIRRALGVAIRTFDAWILADEQALTRVLGDSIQRQPSPETIPNPKAVCADLLRCSSCGMSPSEMYAAVADEADLKVVAARCPDGFAPFANRVRSL